MVVMPWVGLWCAMVGGGGFSGSYELRLGCEWVGVDCSTLFVCDGRAGWIAGAGVWLSEMGCAPWCL